MKKIISFLMLFACFCAVSMAQAPKSGDVISGNVADDIEPLMMVNVVEIDQNKRIVAAGTTDINGNFSFRIKNPKDMLQFSYIGYKTVSLPINKKFYKIVLQNANTIATVEIKHVRKTQSTGLAIPVTEMSVASQTIDMKEFEGLAMTSVDEALQGRIAGLDIVANSGNLGAGTTMRLRGVSTINGNANPLIVVNGNVWTNDRDADFDYTNANEERFAELLNVNPEDIESVTVLKDAAATAVWGSQGANGVIEIKTKRGQRGKTKVQYSYRFTGTWQPEGYKLLNGDDYTMYMKESFFNVAQNSKFADRTPGNADYIPEIDYNTQFSEYDEFNDNTNWAKKVKQFGMYHQHFVSLTGGGEKAQFRISGGYDKQSGSIIRQKLDRFTTRVALDYFVSNRITVRTNFNLTYTKNQKNYNQGGDLIGIALRKMPNLSPYEEVNGVDTGRYYTMNKFVNAPYPAAANLLSEQYGLANPLAIADYARNDEKVIQLSPEFILKYDILGTEDSQTRLTYEGQVIFDISSSDNNSYLPGNILSANWTSNDYNVASVSSYKSNGVSTRHALTFRPHFNNEDHSLLFLAQMQYNTGSSSSQGNGTKWLPTSSITSPFGGGVNSGNFSTGAGQWKSNYYLFQAHYSYKGRYSITATLRRDGSTQFGPSKRWGNFPGVSGRWNISDEPFMQKFKWLTMLSIRPGWGIVGRSPGSEGLFYSKYNTGNKYMGHTTMKPSNIRLAGLQWEEKETYNLGFDFGFFDNKLTADLSLYTQTTRDLLNGGYGIPSSTGYSQLSNKNIGKMRNEGFEFNINGNRILERGKFYMDFNITFANNRNKIISMDPTVLDTYNKDYDFNNGTYLSRIQINNPLGSIYGFRYKGVYQYSDYPKNPVTGAYDEAYAEKGVSGADCPYARDAEGNIILNSKGNPKQMYFDYAGHKYPFTGGDAKYEDINHDGDINQLDIVYLGSSLPKLTGGFGFKFHYDRWSLNLQFNYRTGNKVINSARMGLENMSTSDNQSRAINWRWRTEGDICKIPRAVTTKTSAQTFNYLGSDRFVEDASFLRLNYAQLSYAFEPKLLKQWGMSTLSFYLNMNNLFVLTKYSGADPEIAQAGMYPAQDGSRTPRSKSFTLGATIAF